MADGRCPCYPKEPAVAHQGEAEAGDSPDAFTRGQVDSLGGGCKRSEGLGAQAVAETSLPCRNACGPPGLLWCSPSGKVAREGRAGVRTPRG